MTIVRNLIVPQIEPRGNSAGNPIITTVSLPAAEVATAYSFQMTATSGVPPYTWSISSAIPDATISITSGGLLQWTPTSTTGNPGSELVNIRVTDSLNAPTAPTAFNISVYPQVSITTTSLPSGTTGVAYSATLAATGGLPPYTWGITGGDTRGFPVLNTSTGGLSGTPTQAENLSIVATVTDTLGGSAQQTFPVSITSASGSLAIFTLNLPYATQNIAYSQSLQATGGTGNYTWSLTSPITPSGTGITLASNGVLSGTCSSVINQSTSPSTITIPAQVTDGTTTLTRTYTLAVMAQPLLTYNARTDQAAVNMTVPTLTGAYNQIVSDDLSGFRILRVTDAANSPGNPSKPTQQMVANDGSAESCRFSALGTYFYAIGTGTESYFYKFNKATFQVTILTPGGTLAWNFFVVQWDPVQDNICYGRLSTNNTRISSLNVLTGATAVAWDCSAVSATYGNPDDLSVADNLNIAARFGPQDTAHAAAVLNQGVQHVYDTFAQTIDGVSTGLATGVTIHNVRMGQDGRYVRITSGNGMGIYIWDLTNNNVIHPAVGSISGHQSLAWGQFLQGNNTSAIPFSQVAQEICTIGATALTNFRDLYTPPGGLWPGNPSPAVGSDSYSCYQNQRAGMTAPLMAMSVGDTNTTSPTLPYFNEQMMIQTNAANGAGTCWRVGRTYSYSNGDFFDLAQGSISRDGRYMLFHSNWTNTLGGGGTSFRKDVFIRELQGGTLSQDAFPRSAVLMTGGNPNLMASGNTNAGVPFATVAAQSTLVAMGNYLGYEAAVGTTVQSLILGWRSAAASNGLNLRAVSYIPGGSAYWALTSTPSGFGWLANALANANMWLYTSAAGSGTTNLQIYNGFASEAFPLFTTANAQTVTSFTYNGKTGVNAGMNVWNAAAQYYWDVFSQGLSASKYGDPTQAAVPALNGFFVDNMMSGPWPHFFTSGSSTWNGQGTAPIANSSEPTGTIQIGESKLVTAFSAQNPNILLVANSDFANHQPTLDPSNQNLWPVVFNEDVMSNLEPFSPGLMPSLIAAEALVAPGGTLIVHQAASPGAVNNLGGNQSTWGATQWRSVRFGFAAAMMRNYHYCFNCGVGQYSSVGLLDEQVQGGSYGWLSNGTQRLDPPQSAAFANGVWRRRFPNGWVLWNPRGNGTQIVTIPSTLARLTTRGYGDATVNTGATGATTVTLQDADGLFLIGTG